MKKTLFVFALALLIAALLCSCATGGKNEETSQPTDEPTDPVSGSGDGPDEPEVPESKLVIVDKNGKCGYTIVRPMTAGKEILDAMRELNDAIGKIGDKPGLDTDLPKENLSEYEILIGTTKYENTTVPIPGKDYLGRDDYLIRVIDNRVVIRGGSETSTLEGVRKFITLLPEKGAFMIDRNYSFYYSPDKVLEGIEYNGVPIQDFSFSYPEGDKICETAIETLRARIFKLSGIYLDGNGDGTHKIVLSTVKDGTAFDFKAENGNIYLTGSERTGLSRGISMALSLLAGTVSESVYKVEQNTKATLDNFGTVVCYEDFGAVGDGKTDDMEAICKAHEYANEKGLPVYAKEGATYYIGSKALSAHIKTDTDWQYANFIVDDSGVDTTGNDRYQEIFIVNATYGVQDITGQVTKLSKGQTKIDLKFPGRCIVTAYNSNKKQFIRYGNNQDGGSDMTDTFLVDENGNVDPSTPISWDFDTVTSINYRCIEEKPLMIVGGTFTTIANKEDSSHYYYRGIRIYRSNVTVEGLKHYVTGEGSVGSPYYGILIVHGSVDSKFINCVFTGHKTYKAIGSAGNTVSKGTYDFTVTNCINIEISGCTQTNSITDSKYWGVFASNTSRNLLLSNCVFSRFDAHRGVRNVTIIGCELGHQGINLIGGGTALIENTKVHNNNNFINLRSDYGSTWEGDLIIKNCVFAPAKAPDKYIIINGSNPCTHDFGYTCYLPKNITIDGLEIRGASVSSTYLFANFNSSWNSDNYSPKYPMVITEKVTVKNLKVGSSGTEMNVSPNKFMFKNVQIEYQN